MIVDQHGVLVQKQSDGSLDGGDSVNWMGHYDYLTNHNTIDFFRVDVGAYVRHPDPLCTNNQFGAYYKSPFNGCISRDMLTGILMSRIKNKEYIQMLDIIGHHALRLFLFAYNTIHNGTNPKYAKLKMPDVTLFDIWALEIRGLGWFGYLMFPILCLFDLQLLFGSLLFNKKNDTSDPLSFAGKLCISQEFIKTPISKLAWKVTNKEKLLNNLKTYWSGWRQQPEMYDLYEKKIKELSK